MVQSVLNYGISKTTCTFRRKMYTTVVSFVQVKLNSPWWLDVIQRAIRSSYDDDLVSRVKNELTCSYKQQAQKFSMADK